MNNTDYRTDGSLYLFWDCFYQFFLLVGAVACFVGGVYCLVSPFVGGMK